MKKKRIFRFALLWMLFIIGLLLYNSMVEWLEPHENAILYERWEGGVNKQNIYTSGLQITTPWDYLIKYNISPQEGSEEISFLSKDGNTHTIQLSYNFQCESSKLGFLNEEVGQDYHSKIVKPEIRAAVREAFSRYVSEEIRSSEFVKWEKEILFRSKGNLRKRYINLNSVSVGEVN